MINSRFLEAYKIIKDSHNVILVTHNRPDGDALASVCAFMEWLNILGKNYFAYCLDAPAWQYHFLPRLDEINYDKSRLDFSQYDLIIAVDCGSLKRTNLSEEINARRPEQTVIEFDHHPKAESFSDLEVRLPDASSTAEVIYYFLKFNKVRLNKNLANCLLTGILTDTENFLFPTTDKTIKISSELLSYGPSFLKIIQGAYRNKSLDSIKLWGLAMSNLKINRRYQIAYSVITKNDFNLSEMGEEAEGISNFLSNLEGVNAVLFLREESGGKLRGSLRTSKNNINLSRLAQFLGGGGHAKASGFTIEGGIETIADGWKII